MGDTRQVFKPGGRKDEGKKKSKSGRGPGGAAVVRAARGADGAPETGETTAAADVAVGVCWGASLAADHVVRRILI